MRKDQLMNEWMWIIKVIAKAQTEIDCSIAAQQE